MAFSIAFFSYLALVVGVAIAACIVTRNLSDFVLGGRRLNGPIAALSAGASDMSAWLLLGLPGAAYLYGMNQIWLPISLTLGAYLNWRFVAKPLRVYTEVANDSLTIPAFLSNRLRDHSSGIRCIAALATLIFFCVYTASGLVGGAMLMERSFGLDYELALLAGTSIIVAYTFVGGFLAVSWTDFAQGIFMFFCLLSVPVLVGYHYGGIDPVMTWLGQQDPEFLNPFSQLSTLGFINLIAWGVGYFGQPHILVRFMAVRGVKDIPIARRIAISWMSLSMVGAMLTGILGFLYFEGRVDNPESVFIYFAYDLFNPIISGVIIAAILSSIMCAIDSQMLTSSSAVTEDVYHGFMRPNATQKELVWLGRLALIVIATIAITVAYFSGKGVLDLVGFAWAGLACTFAVPVCGALFYRQFTRHAAMWAMSTGAITAIVWAMLSGGIFDIYEMIPGVVASFVGACIGMRFGEPATQEQLAEFDNVKIKLAALS